MTKVKNKKSFVDAVSNAIEYSASKGQTPTALSVSVGRGERFLSNLLYNMRKGNRISKAAYTDVVKIFPVIGILLSNGSVESYPLIGKSGDSLSKNRPLRWKGNRPVKRELPIKTYTKPIIPVYTKPIVPKESEKVEESTDLVLLRGVRMDLQKLHRQNETLIELFNKLVDVWVK